MLNRMVWGRLLSCQADILHLSILVVCYSYMWPKMLLLLSVLEALNAWCTTVGHRSTIKNVWFASFQYFFMAVSPKISELLHPMLIKAYTSLLKLPGATGTGSTAFSRFLECSAWSVNNCTNLLFSTDLELLEEEASQVAMEKNTA